MIVGRQEGHRVTVTWNEFAFEREYITNKSVDKRGTEEHHDR